MVVGGVEGLGRRPELSISVARTVCAVAALVSAAAALAGSAIERLARSWHGFWCSLSAQRFAWWVAALATFARLPVALLPTSPEEGDTIWYHKTAIALARGAGFSCDGVPTAYRPPGYSFLLSLAYKVAGPRPQVAWFWGTLATALLLFSAYGAAASLYGAAVARIATVGLAVYPALAFLTGQTMSDLVFTAALTAVVHRALTGGTRNALAILTTGVALGLVALVRSIGIAAVVPILLVALADRGARTIAMIAVPLVAGLMLPLSFWALRNHGVFGLFALDTNTGFNLLIGNHPGASGGYSWDNAARMFAPPPYDALNLNEVRLDRVYASRALSFIGSNPGQWLLSWPKKLVHLFALEVSAARGVLPETTRSLWLKYGLYALGQLSYAALFTAFCVRLLSFADRELRPRRRQWVGLAIGATVACVAVVTFGLDRYRLPFLPWMMIEASVAFCGYCGSRAVGVSRPAGELKLAAVP